MGTSSFTAAQRTCSDYFFGGEFRHFPKSILKNNILWQIPCLGGGGISQKTKPFFNVFLIT
jgi:hypothetical protein